MGVQINQLSSIDQFQPQDKFVVYQNSNGDARQGTVNQLTEYMQENIQLTTQFTTVRAIPTASGFTISLADGSDSRWLIITPNASYGSGTLVLPSNTSLQDRQEVLFNTTAAVTSFTIDPNGAADVIGYSPNLSINEFQRLKYDAATNTWYRVG